MRPTVDEQLSGIDRLLEQIGSDTALGAESAQLLRDARRQLGRLRGSLDLRLPFLRWDTAASLAVLRSAESHLPNDLLARLDELDATPASDGLTESGIAEHNDAVRTLLGETIDALGDSDPDALRRIVEHLTVRAAVNPALNKNPTIPAMPDEEL